MTAQNPQSFARMISSRHDESVCKQAATAATINNMLLDGTLISITTVAHKSGVSRNFIYSHRDLLHQLEAARQTQRDAQIASQRMPTHGAAGEASLRTELALANQTIRRLRHELSKMANRHQFCLGEQVEEAEKAEEAKNSSAASIASHVEQLTEENHTLTEQLKTMSHRINDLLDDLTAERATNHRAHN